MTVPTGLKVVSSSKSRSPSLGASLANTPSKFSGARVWVSMAPMVASSTQSPLNTALPVVSLDAATSAPVRSASCWINAWPVGPSATSQPYSNKSPSLESEAPMLASVLPYCARLSPVSTLLPKYSVPAEPCEITCMASRLVTPVSACAICVKPSCNGSRMTAMVSGASAARMLSMLTTRESIKT